MGNEIEPAIDQTAVNVDEPTKKHEDNLQDGVRTAQAVTLAWSKKSLIIVYIW